ncbi:hypothetical protein BLNAU_17916 [Blattamonas nauphoetae]|uniref:Uncharacterized protein n=1 Tax=Blattamonas nauphoetae TaxID=2049346 RepID=A0ABQ9XA97_9EUKA|nr:hypothetical protein BLNAU_17916 [Blattamonas nauphoetae]
MEIQGFEPSTYTCKSLDLPAEPLQHQKVGFLELDSTLYLRFDPQTQIPPSNSDSTLKLKFHPQTQIPPSNFDSTLHLERTLLRDETIPEKVSGSLLIQIF